MMTLPRPYGITDEELNLHGSTNAVIEARYAEVTKSLDSYDMPRPESFDWCPKSKQWGKVWASAQNSEIRHQRLGFRGYMVFAGIGGTMSRVPVAHKLPTLKSAQAFAIDFEQGKIMCATCIGAILWEELVDAAWSIRKIGIDRDALKSLAREVGVIGPYKLNRGGLLSIYQGGETIDDALAAIQGIAK